MIDPSDKIWSIILQGKHIPHSEKNHYLSFDISSNPFYATQVPNSYEEVESDYVHAISNDHE